MTLSNFGVSTIKFLKEKKKKKNSFTKPLLMIKHRRIRITNNPGELNLSNSNFDDEQEEFEFIEGKGPFELKKLLLFETRIGPNNTQKLFQCLEKYTCEILCSNNSQIPHLATYVANAANWTRIKIIHLVSNCLKDKDIINIAQNSTWTELRILRLSKNLIGDEGAISLGKNTSWKNLRVLDLSYNRIEHDGAIGLAENSTWSELTELDLQYNLLDDESAFALGRNSAWKRLEKGLIVKGNLGVRPTKKLLFSINSKVSNEFYQELEESKGKDLETLINEKEMQFKSYYEQLLTNVRDERIDELKRVWDIREKFGTASFEDNGIQDRNKESHFLWAPKLESLKMAGCGINKEGAELISKTASWINLQQADFSRTTLGETGIRMLAKNTTWMNLRSLDVSVNFIGDEGCRSLAQNSSWKLLEQLNLKNNNITDKGVLALSQNWSWTNLQRLDLSENKITDKGACYLGQNANWKRLEEINFNINDFHLMQGIDSLITNKNWKHLKRISLFTNPIPIEELVLFLENHDPFSTPLIELEVRKYSHCLNLKYSRKLAGIKLNGEFEAIINELNEQFYNEINHILIHSSPGKQSQSWENFLLRRKKLTISPSLMESEGFNLKNLHLLWFPEAKTLDLTESTSELSCWSQFSEHRHGNITAEIVALLQKPVSWLSIEEAYFDRSDLTDDHLSEFENVRYFRNLKKLSLMSNNITDEGALKIAKIGKWKRLEELDLKGNLIRRYKTAIALTENRNWPNFTVLQISGKEIREERCGALQSFPKTKVKIPNPDPTRGPRNPQELNPEDNDL